MVRIKYRYLLVNILYPDPSPFILTPITTISPPSPHLPPALLQFHAPTPNHLTPQLLARTIKDQIALLYGDYGVGVTAASLNGIFISFLSFSSYLFIPLCVVLLYGSISCEFFSFREEV